MIDTALVEILKGAGPVGVLAVGALWMYRQQVKQMRQDRKFSEDRFSTVIEKDQETREKHTAVLTELTTLLKRLNGH